MGFVVIATTRATLLRTPDDAPATDALGDPIDDNTAEAIVPGAEDFPASIIERSRREFDQASNTWRTIRYFATRVPANIAPLAGDRLRDREGRLYIVTEVERMARGIGGRSSVSLSMRRSA